jgi:hypothetical protein
MDERARQFKQRLCREVLRHPAIAANPYTAWFRRGTLAEEHARAFLVQFSVFSNRFLVAQLHKMLNAETLAEMRASKEILANEIGVGFRRERGGPSPGRRAEGNAQAASDAELGSAEGTIEGGTFHFRAAHFELLVRMAAQFGLAFEDLGRRRFGTAETLHFCDELIRLYGHEDYAIAAAASWAVENWAAAGFWDELVEGWRRYGERNELDPFDIGFFTWHARLESNHARHTDEELEHIIEDRRFDEDDFIAHAVEMLDGVHVFWRGLERQRKNIANEAHHVG